MEWPLTKPVIAAEIGLSHDGSLALAHGMVDSIADAGADIVKFQVHVADSESTLDEPFRDSTYIRDKTRYDYWKRTEFALPQWHELVDHIRERNLEPIASTFSPAGMDIVSELGVTAWKIGSAESRQPWFVREVASRAKIVIGSTGMSTWNEIDELVNIAREADTPMILLQCTSQYPSDAAGVGINVLDEFRERYGIAVGLSDHSSSLIPSIVAMTMAAIFIEVHVTYSRDMAGPDSASSLTFEGLEELVNARDTVTDILNNRVDKDAVASSLEHTREIFGRSLAVMSDIRAGEEITVDKLVGKKPGGGIPMSALAEVAGTRAARDISPLRLLTPEDYSS